jgi:RND family efflux transporter MFP subunit
MTNYENKPFGGRPSILAVALLLAALPACRRGEVPAPLPVAVRVATLSHEQITSETRFTATVRERQRIELSFKVKVPGTIASLLQVTGVDGKPRDVHEGDVVTADPQRPLARLDDTDYRRQLEIDRERLAQALAKQRAGQATVTGVRANYDRVKALRASESVAQQVYDEALAKKDAAEAELEAAEGEVRAAKLAIQQAEDDLRNCGILVPIPRATVSRKFIEGSERVMPNHPVFQLMDLSSLRVAFGVPDSKVSQFELGQTVKVTADSFRGERFAGRVTKIGPAADLKTRTFEVEVTIDEPHGLKPGMVVTIIVGQAERVVLMPMTAVQRGATKDEFAVYAVIDENGQLVARQRRVALDGVYDNRIRLVEGSVSQVTPGDTIVVSGAFRLTDGQAVRVLDLQEPALRIGI